MMMSRWRMISTLQRPHVLQCFTSTPLGEPLGGIFRKQLLRVLFWTFFPQKRLDHGKSLLSQKTDQNNTTWSSQPQIPFRCFPQPYSFHKNRRVAKFLESREPRNDPMAAKLPVAGSAFVAPSLQPAVRKVSHVGSNAAVAAKSTSHGMTMAGESLVMGKGFRKYGRPVWSWKSYL